MNVAPETTIGTPRGVGCKTVRMLPAHACTIGRLLLRLCTIHEPQRYQPEGAANLLLLYYHTTLLYYCCCLLYKNKDYSYSPTKIIFAAFHFAWQHGIKASTTVVVEGLLMGGVNRPTTSFLRYTTVVRTLQLQGTTRTVVVKHSCSQAGVRTLPLLQVL